MSTEPTAVEPQGRKVEVKYGGSSADAQHLATELLIRLRSSVERPSWPAIALTLDPTALTAGGNDYGFRPSMSRIVRAILPLS